MNIFLLWAVVFKRNAHYNSESWNVLADTPEEAVEQVRGAVQSFNLVRVSPQCTEDGTQILVRVPFKAMHTAAIEVLPPARSAAPDVETDANDDHSGIPRMTSDNKVWTQDMLQPRPEGTPDMLYQKPVPAPPNEVKEAGDGKP